MRCMNHSNQRTLWVACAALVASQTCAAGTLSTRQATKVGERCWADVRTLSADAMEGRRAGTPGHRRAAEFVAAQFKQAKLQPGGDDGFFQAVQLESRKIVEANSSLALVGKSGKVPLELGKDAILLLRGDYAKQLEAPMVFVGDGLKLPQYGVDDLAGLDLEGKVVVTFITAPPSIPGAAGAHFGSVAERWKVYRAAGAVGMVGVPNPANMDLSWDRIAKSRFDPYMVLGGNAEDLLAGQRLLVQFNPDSFGKLLAGTPYDAQQMFKLLNDGAPLPRFDLAVSIASTIDSQLDRVTSENVVAVLPGSDPKLRDEYVVLSAHLDHLGVSTAAGEDRVFNGAMDNASGVAVLLQIARELSKGKAPRRSVVFLAVTGEEVGLLGSRAFVSAAQTRGMKIVANLNTDMFLPLYPMRQLLVFGLDESELRDDVNAVAAQSGLKVQPDPQPLRNRFIRSDQYSFIRAGIPSLATKVGFEAGTPDAELEKKWIAERYHAVSDSADQPVDLSAVGRYEDVIRRLAVRIADRDQAPRWLDSSVFSHIKPVGAARAATSP
jgi:Zn-dependent M28 family amino/carboxypeptidase